MSRYSKVFWKEGLFIRPQHLQQADRYVEKLVEARTSVITPYPWGVVELEIDRDMAQQGRVGLRSVVGIMPDGAPFDAPGSDPLPKAVPVPEEANGLSVWLTLPDKPQDGREISFEDDADATRYALKSESVADNTAAIRSVQPIEIAVPRLELAVRKSPKPGYQCIRLARINEVKDGVIAFDTTVPPPALVLDAHPVIEGFLTRVIGWV